MNTSTGPRVIGAEGLHAREISLQNKQRALGWNLLVVATAPTVVGWMYCREGQGPRHVDRPLRRQSAAGQ